MQLLDLLPPAAGIRRFEMRDLVSIIGLFAAGNGPGHFISFSGASRVCGHSKACWRWRMRSFICGVIHGLSLGWDRTISRGKKRSTVEFTLAVKASAQSEIDVWEINISQVLSAHHLPKAHSADSGILRKANLLAWEPVALETHTRFGCQKTMEWSEQLRGALHSGEEQNWDRAYIAITKKQL